MAIPEGRLSTTPVPGTLQPPENRKFYSLTSYELGPVAIEDTSEGLMYQNWTLTWNTETFELIATPETTGMPVSVTTVEALRSVSFTFDQNARISIAWVTATSSYLYWYDTALGSTTVTDLGVETTTPAILLDDKRTTQNQANDMLLFYTKLDINGKYALFMKVQRDRFLIEYLMKTDLSEPYIHNIGMNDGLRIQLTLKGNVPNIPYEPPIPNDPYNLDFESGYTHWTQNVGGEWGINQVDAYSGSWSAILNSTGVYSFFENDHYFPVTGNQSVTIKMFSKGTIGQGLAFGYATYDSNFAPISGSQLGINVEADWKEDEWTDTVAANAAYIRVTMQSNGQVGTYHVDNFSVIA